MAPLIILACILVALLGNAWLLSGMPAVKPAFVVFAASLVSCIYFVIGMPVIAVVLARRYRRTRVMTASLLSAVVMLAAFYFSAVFTWLLLSRGWHLSFLKTIDAARDAETYGELDAVAENLLLWLMLIVSVATAAAGAVTAGIAHAWIKRSRRET